VLKIILLTTILLFPIQNTRSKDYPLSDIYHKDSKGELFLQTNDSDDKIESFGVINPETGIEEIFPAIDITEGISILKMEKYDVINLRSPYFNFHRGGEIEIDYMYNGIAGSRRKSLINLNESLYLLKEGVKVESMTIIENTFLGKVIGIKKILFNNVNKEDFKLRWYEKHPDHQIWTDHLYNTILIEGKDLLTTEIKDFDNYCLEYKSLNNIQKLNFWAYLFTSIAQLESSFRPELYYQEGFDDNNGRPIISRGLFQLSIESGRGYQCDIPNENSLHEPLRNITCAVKIMNRWVRRDKVISKYSGGWKGGARYWAVLRNKIARIKGWMRSINFKKN